MNRGGLEEKAALLLMLVQQRAGGPLGWREELKEFKPRRNMRWLQRETEKVQNERGKNVKKFMWLKLLTCQILKLLLISEGKTKKKRLFREFFEVNYRF